MQIVLTIILLFYIINFKNFLLVILIKFCSFFESVHYKVSNSHFILLHYYKIFFRVTYTLVENCFYWMIWRIKKKYRIPHLLPLHVFFVLHCVYIRYAKIKRRTRCYVAKWSNFSSGGSSSSLCQWLLSNVWHDELSAMHGKPTCFVK